MVEIIPAGSKRLMGATAIEKAMNAQPPGLNIGLGSKPIEANGKALTEHGTVWVRPMKRM